MGTITLDCVQSDPALDPPGERAGVTMTIIHPPLIAIPVLTLPTAESARAADRSKSLSQLKGRRLLEAVI